MVAEALVKVKPTEPRAWLLRSFALHELKRTQEGFDLLLPATEKFAGEWAFPYNHSCYCAQLGRFDESRFKKALAIDERSTRAAAIIDPDLKPLLDSMSGTIWKRNE